MLSSQTRQPLVGLAVQRPSSSTSETAAQDAQPAVDPEEVARDKVLAQPDKVKQCAELLGKDVWMPLTWQQRLEYIEEACDEEMRRHPDSDPPTVASKAPSDHMSRGSQNSPVPCTPSKDGEETRVFPTSPTPPPSDRPLASVHSHASHQTSTAQQQQLSHQSMPQTCDPVPAYFPPTPPAAFTNAAAPVDKVSNHSGGLAAPAASVGSASVATKKRASMRKSSRKSKLLTRKALEVGKLNQELEANLQSEVPKGVLKQLRTNPAVEYMRIVESHTSSKRPKKRVVIIEPHQMVVTNPNTGRELRHIALEKLSAIDYQDKEFGRSVVMRFDGEADAAFVQNEKPNPLLDAGDDMLMSTTVNMARGVREQKGLPPRLIEPSPYPMYKDLLASAHTNAAHDPDDDDELAAWEQSVNPPSKKSQPNITPNNTLRSHATLCFTAMDKQVGPPSAAGQAEQCAPPPSKQIVQHDSSAQRESSVPFEREQSGQQRKSHSPSQSQSGWGCGPSQPVSQPASQPQPQSVAQHPSVPQQQSGSSAHTEGSKAQQDVMDQVQRMLSGGHSAKLPSESQQLAAIASAAEAGVHPRSSTPACDSTALREELFRELERGSNENVSPEEVTELREKLLEYYSSLPPSDQAEFEQRVFRMRAQKRERSSPSPSSPSPSRARVLQHHVGHTFDFPPPFPSTDSPSPVRSAPHSPAYDTVRNISPRRYRP